MDQWTVYGTRSCGYTVRAMNMLRQKKIPFTFNDVSQKAARDAIIATSGRRTIPVIYRNGVLIGGCTELQKILK